MTKKAIIIVVGGIKGGPGKTTIAVNLASWLTLHNKSTLLIDTDDQRSASDFTAYRSETLGNSGYTFVNMAGENVRVQVINLANGFDFIVIDCAGRDTTEQRAALSIADIFLIPIKPRGSFDFWPVVNVKNLVDLAKQLNPGLKAYSFLSQADVSSEDNRSVIAGLKGFEPTINVLDLKITNRKAFAHSCIQGLSIFEYKDAKDPAKYVDGKAAEEMGALFIEIMNQNQIVVS